MARGARQLVMLPLALTLVAYLAEGTHHHRHHREVSATEVRPAASAFLSAAPDSSAPADSSSRVDSEAEVSAEAVIADAERQAAVPDSKAAFVQESATGKVSEQLAAKRQRQVDDANEDEEDEEGGDSDETVGVDADSEESADDDEEADDKEDEQQEPAAPAAASSSMSNLVSASRPAAMAAPVAFSAARKEQEPEQKQLKVVMPGQTLESNYGPVGDSTGYVSTPKGYRERARQRLQENLMQQARISALMQDMQNETGFQDRVSSDMNKLMAETQTSALAKMLGGMRKEMRQFSRPFYLEHLYGEMRRLKEAEKGLQADLEQAEGNMGSGHQGWPGMGEKVIVAEASFHRPRDTEENAVKKLRIEIPEKASLAQMDSDDDRGAAFFSARVSFGAIAAAFILATSAYAF